MTALRKLLSGLIALIAAVGLFASAAHAAKRVALVIGNSAYKHTPELTNPTNDAADITATLKQLGFEVVEGRDLDKAGMDRTIMRFAEMLANADLGTFFYAGHGLQVNGVNYLVPVDAKLSTAYALDFEMVRLDIVQRVMENASQTNVIFLDACRDNPLSRNLARALGTRSTSIGRGLAQVEAGLGTLISYATQPGAVALDGSGRNSPYSAALKKRLLTPGEDLTSILIGVRNDVLSATASRQVPWDQHALRAKLYLRGQSSPGGDSARQAQVERQIANARSEQVLDVLLRLEPARAAEIEAKRRALLEEERKQQLASLDQQRREKEQKALEAAAAREHGQSAQVKTPGTVFRDCPDCPEMVALPTGSFLMGSPKSEEGHQSNEEGPGGKPLPVIIGYHFAAGKFEVTFEEWDACVADGGCKQKPGDWGWGRGKRPVINISWNDITGEYLPWLNRKLGLSGANAYRLLTEAEWEYAARGITSASTRHTRYSLGDDIDCSKANYGGGVGSACDFKIGKKYRGTKTVGSYTSNTFGLHDMHGNAWEWVQDCYADSHAKTPTDGSKAPVTKDCSRRVLRGGAWGNHPLDLRAAVRMWSRPGVRLGDGGFRLARTLEP